MRSALLVHGLGRSPVSMFPLAGPVRRAGVRPHFFGYSASVESMPRIVARLKRTLTTRRPDYLIGHSLGGILLRLALAELPELPIRHFLMLGRCIERADMTSRLIATSAVTAGGPSAATDSRWASTLRACGAYEAFLRTYKGMESERGAAEFLLLDRLFPRSVVFALSRAELCLDTLESVGSASSQRAGFQNEAQRLLGRTRAELEYRSLPDVVADLPTEMERLQRTCAA